MVLYLRFEKGTVAGLLVGLLMVAALVASGSYATAVESSDSAVAVLAHAAVALTCALAGGLFAVGAGRWSGTPGRGTLCGLALGGVGLLLRGPFGGLVEILVRGPVAVDLTNLLGSLPLVSSWIPPDALSGDRAELVARVLASLLLGTLWGLLYGTIWQRSRRPGTAA